jgi:hypothetical protein
MLVGFMVLQWNTWGKYLIKEKGYLIHSFGGSSWRTDGPIGLACSEDSKSVLKEQNGHILNWYRKIEEDICGPKIFWGAFPQWPKAFLLSPISHKGTTNSTTQEPSLSWGIVLICHSILSLWGAGLPCGGDFSQSRQLPTSKRRCREVEGRGVINQIVQ